ncbi:histidine phosphatase family protein [Lutibacter sp.]|uniref:histidine phosphatase family protein n=1 Tax=Lutibacter sp. TaxID=1925666 RepID=UPI0025B9EA27|nr:histidine phosphatase family protein [Lutibacter sp.]MCF6182907.1 histidine phosphatase family protein [Lutibacter sp.]
MKYLLILFFSINGILTMNSQSKDNKVTTYYLIRHAEKNRTNASNKDPELTKIGLQRAEKWANTFKNVKFDKVYATNFKRAIQTAKPTAIANNVTIEFYNPFNLYAEDFKKNTIGKMVLIVGHSNTTPFFVNKILEENKYPEIDDAINSNLYIVTVTRNSKTSVLLSFD